MDAGEQYFPLGHEASWDIYGGPFVLDEANYDFLASCLNESGVGLIYYPPETQFYFRDYLHENCYRPTSDGRVEALIRKLVYDSSMDAPSDVKNGLKTLLKGAGMTMERSKIINAVESCYFVGEEGHKRWMDGKFVEPVEKPSVTLFAESRITRRKGQILTNGDAYRFYYAFCHESGLPPVKKTLFIDRFTQEVRKKWKIGVRNDLKVEGRCCSGWGELAVV